jgi:hypothetical protein
MTDDLIRCGVISFHSGALGTVRPIFLPAVFEPFFVASALVIGLDDYLRHRVKGLSLRNFRNTLAEAVYAENKAIVPV